MHIINILSHRGSWNAKGRYAQDCNVLLLSEEIYESQMHELKTLNHLILGHICHLVN